MSGGRRNPQTHLIRATHVPQRRSSARAWCWLAITALTVTALYVWWTA